MNPSALSIRIVVLLAAAMGATNAAAQNADVETSELALRAGGGIRATVFEQAGAKSRPVILVLYGAGGMIFDGPEMRRVSRHLAAHGNAVYLLRYFNASGTIVAFDRTMERHFPMWRDAVRDSVAEIQALRGDQRPVGIYGYSLGGFLALFTASDNARVGAVVEHAGGVWKGKLDRIGKLPPVLMVHGERDARVPFAVYAKPLLPVLRRRAAKVETRFFPAEGHTFTAESMRTVRADAARFFRRHLGRD